MGGSTSLQQTEQASASNTSGSQAARSSGNWSLINQQIATGSSKLSASQAATDSSGLSWYWIAGGAGLLVFFYILSKRR